MSTILFDKIVFGPVHSRRLGVSLGMNLLPGNRIFYNTFELRMHGRFSVTGKSNHIGSNSFGLHSR